MRRYDVRRGRHRRLPWLGYTLMAINIVVIAFLVFDTPLGQAAKNLSPRLIGLAGTVTNMGRLISILTATATVLAVILVIIRRQPLPYGRFRSARFIRMAAYVGLSVVSTSVIVNLLKYMIGRARPPLYEQYGIFGFKPFDGGFLFESFPSAHSANVGAFFVALALLFPRFRLLFIGIALWLGATRIIIGVHYPSDVAAGLAFGGWIAVAVAVVFSRFGLVFSTATNGWPCPRACPVFSDR